MSINALFSRNRPRKLSAVLAILIVAAIGTYLLVNSHAATPNTSINAAQGNLAGNASLQPDSTASNGQKVVFGQAIPMDGSVALGLSTPGTPFAPTSFWNTPLPASTPVNPNNAAYLNDIAYNLCHDTPVDGSPPNPCTTPNSYGNLNSATYSSPLYVVPASQPHVPVQQYCSNGATTNLNSYFMNTVLAPGVPIPVDAHAAAGTDEHISIYQPSSNTYWDFWRLQKNSSGNWEACWGGVMNNVSQSNGIFSNNGGGTATSLPLLGGIPRIEELQAGQINHVINLTLDGNLSQSVIPANTPGATNGISWPATRTDGTSTDPLAIPEGTRFRLPASLNLSSYNLSPIAKAIAAAAQKYGFVVDDSGVTVTIRLGDPTTYTNTPSPNLPNPYTSGSGVGGVGSSGLFGGVASNLAMQNFPWNQLQALPYSYGEPGTP